MLSISLFSFFLNKYFLNDFYCSGYVFGFFPYRIHFKLVFCMIIFFYRVTYLINYIF